MGRRSGNYGHGVYPDLLYYQAFYEGDSLKARYDNIRFKLERIQSEVVQNSSLASGTSSYNLGNYCPGFNENRQNVNRLSEYHLTGIDRINARVSAVRAWIFIFGSILLILSKYIHFFGREKYDG